MLHSNKLRQISQFFLTGRFFFVLSLLIVVAKTEINIIFLLWGIKMDSFSYDRVEFACIQCTSGITNNSKGVKISHYNFSDKLAVSILQDGTAVCVGNCR